MIHYLWTRVINYFRPICTAATRFTKHRVTTQSIALVAALLAATVSADISSGQDPHCNDPYACSTPSVEVFPENPEGLGKPKYTKLLPKHSVTIQQVVGPDKVPLSADLRLVGDDMNTTPTGTITVKMRPRTAGMPKEKYPNGRLVEVYGLDACREPSDSRTSKKIRFRRGKMGTFRYDIRCVGAEAADRDFALVIVKRKKNGGFSVLHRQEIDPVPVAP